MNFCFKLIFIALLEYSFLGAQNCTPTMMPTDIFYSNTTSAPTANTGLQYLCGPNTVVYDTLPLGCIWAYLNTGSTLWLAEQGCPSFHSFHLKSGTILNILPHVNSPVPPINIVFEPGAVINNPTGVPTITTACSNITYPIVNCSTGIFEDKDLGSVISLYPNPASNLLTIDLKDFSKSTVQIKITDLNGKLVQKQELVVQNGKTQIETSNLNNGVYILQIQRPRGQTIQKKLIIAK